MTNVIRVTLDEALEIIDDAGATDVVDVDVVDVVGVEEGGVVEVTDGAEEVIGGGGVGEEVGCLVVGVGVDDEGVLGGVTLGDVDWVECVDEEVEVELLEGAARMARGRKGRMDWGFMKGEAKGGKESKDSRNKKKRMVEMRGRIDKGHAGMWARLSTLLLSKWWSVGPCPFP